MNLDFFWKLKNCDHHLSSRSIKTFSFKKEFCYFLEFENKSIEFKSILNNSSDLNNLNEQYLEYKIKIENEIIFDLDSYENGKYFCLVKFLENEKKFLKGNPFLSKKLTKNGEEFLENRIEFLNKLKNAFSDENSHKKIYGDFLSFLEQEYKNKNIVYY